MSSTGSLEVATQDRKARLAQLRGLKRKAPEAPSSAPEDNASLPTQPNAQDEPEPPVTTTYLSGRNYDPETRGPKLGFETAPDAGQDTLEVRAAALQLKQKEEAAKDEEEKDAPIDLFKLQPKKPNWDLKRDLKDRMSVLDVRTKNAIARLVRERLAAEREKKISQGFATADGEDAAVPLEGGELLEAVRVREQQDEEERRREKEDDEELT